MKRFQIEQDNGTLVPSGFSILIHSQAVRLLGHFWMRVNGWGRPILPMLNVFMVAVVAVILGTVVYAGFHVPCWYDEICMLDPAYHRATTGVWHSIVNWDSFDVVPFAPNYPLLINILRGLIACFGVNFWILRGVMLVFGIVPIAVFLWLFKRKGILQSWQEVLCSAFFSSCFTFFYWSVSIRPEALLLAVVVLLVFAWSDNHPWLLFFSALLVPLCGLQWNVLLLPTVLHWLVFGGRLRNPVLVATAFALSTVATIAVYHLLGMWPSYLQEAARVGGLDVFHSVCTKLRSGLALWDWSWLVGAVQTPFYVIIGPMLAWTFASLSLCRGDREKGLTGRMLLFVLGSTLASVFFLGLVGHLLRCYVYLLALPSCLLFPVLAGRWLSRCHTMLFMALVLAAPLVARVHWVQIANGHGPWGGYAGDRFWAYEDELEELFDKILRSDDVVCCDNAGYFALRRQNRDFYLLRYVFSIDPKRARTITALLMIDPRWIDPSAPLAIPDADSISENAEVDSPGMILARLSKQWNCAFKEVWLEPPASPDGLRYRLFRPVFQDGD